MVPILGLEQTWRAKIKWRRLVVIFLNVIKDLVACSCEISSNKGKKPNNYRACLKNKQTNPQKQQQKMVQSTSGGFY